MLITREYLQSHPDEIFVFGDNQLHKGKKGAAELRDEPNTLGFITKKEPTNRDEAFYKPGEYEKIFESEMGKLITAIISFPDKTFLISKLGAGLANRFSIFEKVIEPRLKLFLSKYPNVKFLY